MNPTDNQNTQNPAMGSVVSPVIPTDPMASAVNPTTTAESIAPVGSVAPAATTPVVDPTAPVVSEPVATMPTPVEQPVAGMPGGDTNGGQTPPPAPTV